MPRRQSRSVWVFNRFKFFVQNFYIGLFLEASHVVRKLLLEDLAFEVLFDVWGNFGQLDLLGRNLFAQFDDVIAIGCRDDVADFIGLKTESRSFKFGSHGMLGIGAGTGKGVFTTFVLGSRILGV